MATPDDSIIAGTLAGSLAGLDVKGLFLSPGKWPASVDGKAAEVEVSREVILAAYEQLKADLEAGIEIPIRLSHPGTGDLPLLYGRVLAAQIDRKEARAYLTASEALPEIEKIMTPEARERLWSLGLSMWGPLVADEISPGKLRAKSLRVRAVDIVDRGAAPGSWIMKQLPAGLAAKLTVTTPPGTAGRIVTAKQEMSQMPKLESTEGIPADIREKLSPEEQKAYVTAYNAAVEAGKSPEDAHTAAMAAVKELAAEAEDKNKDVAAKLAASNTEKQRLADRLKQVEAELAAKKGNEQDLAARVDTLTATVRELAAHKQQLEDEKAERAALDDVEKLYILAGKGSRAEKASILAARKAMGAEAFRKWASERPVVIAAGERGVVEQHAPGEDEKEAQTLLRQLGKEGVIAARLHTLDTPVGKRLKALVEAGDR